MRIKTFGLAIGIVACILLLFSILLFVPAVEPSKEYPIIHESDKVLPSGYLADNETDMLIDNGNGTVAILIHPLSLHTGKKAPLRIDNVSVVRGYNYTTDGKKVITEIKLAATEPAVNGVITLLDNGDGIILVSADTTQGYYQSYGYIRHPLYIKPAIESDEIALSVLYPRNGKATNGSAGIVSRLVPFRIENETVYVRGYEKHPSGPAMQWEHTFGNGSASVIIKTDDGGYLIAGHKAVTGSAESRAWLGKVDASGALRWEHVYNGSNIQAVIQHDGDYVAAGSIGGNLWLLKTDKSGNVLIDHPFDGPSFASTGQSITQAGDDGYVVTGNVEYPDNGQSAFIALTDRNLSLMWHKNLSGYRINFGNSVMRANDGNFVVCGGEEGDITKIGANGTVLWNMTPDDHHGLLPVSICQVDDGGYMVAYLDITASWQEGITVSKLNPDGTVVWSNTYYGTRTAYVRSMGRTDNGDYILSGSTFGVANGLYLLKIDDTGQVLWSAVYDSQDIDPGPIVQSGDGGYVMAASDDTRIVIVKFGSLLRQGFSPGGPGEA